MWCNMKNVLVRGANGSTKLLALVREAGSTVYVCPINRYPDVLAGDESSVVGFPVDDVSPEPARVA